jgi:hypothetical protein
VDSQISLWQSYSSYTKHSFVAVSESWSSKGQKQVRVATLCQHGEHPGAPGNQIWRHGEVNVVRGWRSRMTFDIMTKGEIISNHGSAPSGCEAGSSPNRRIRAKKPWVPTRVSFYWSFFLINFKEKTVIFFPFLYSATITVLYQIRESIFSLVLLKRK